jgi:hypothetical protein
VIRGGKGGARTQGGLVFEKRTDLRTLFADLPGYTVNSNDVLFEGHLVAQIFKKYDFHTKFLARLGIDRRRILSKGLVPDDTIFVLANQTLFIIEAKFQEVSGSVDEKLQTCDFKKRQYQRLLLGTGISVEYVYVLSEWFEKKEYKDVLDYVSAVGCRYFFRQLPLSLLGLPAPRGSVEHVA